MKLCFIANPNSFHTRRWLSYFVRKGHEVHLIADRRPEALFPEVTVHDLTALSKIRKLRYLYWGSVVRQLVRSLQPHILHAHQVSSAGWLGWAAGYHPFVVMPWGTDLYQQPKHSKVARWLAERVLRSADLVLADSRDLMRKAIEFGADPACSQIVQWGVDLTTFLPASPQEKAVLRQKFGLGNGPVVLSPRVMKSFYRHEVTVQAAAAVRALIPTTEFLFRNYNPEPVDYPETLRGQAKALGISKAVHFLGPIANYEDIANVYRVADVAVSIPRTDGTPVSMLEAFACGVPVITDRHLPSLAEWIVDGESGLLLDGNDPESISEGIVRLLADKVLYTKIRQKALEVVRTRADHAVWMSRIEVLYKSLCGLAV